ncbi:MAG: tyrosine-type recombinase/integrase [Acidobacteriaceae bacterium]
MGVSHQAGWVVLRGKKWYGYYRRRLLDPETEQERVDTECIRLGPKSQMTRFEARDALRAEITKQTGQAVDGKIRKDSSISFGWFVRNRYLPLREGDWRPETAKIKKIQIEQDLLAKFQEIPLNTMDRFMLQTHLNNLATRLSQDRVKHARSYLKSIFDEAISQEFLLSDPTRKLKVPNHLRPKDKQVLSWEKMREALQRSSRRDRVLLMLDMTGALRPSELFALRWRSFDKRGTLSITETVYKGQIRPFGKTRKSLGDIYLPPGLAVELLRWKDVCPNPSPDAFMFPNAEGGVMDTGNYRNRVLKPLAEKLNVPKLNFQILRRTMATRAQRMGSVKDIQAHLRHSKADTTANEYMQELPGSVKQMVGSVYSMLTKNGNLRLGSGDLLPNATNRVREASVSD